MSLKLVVVFSLYAVTLGIPTKDGGRNYPLSHKQFLLSGVSGQFSYPETGYYENNEIVLIKLPIEQQTVFTVERHYLEYHYDTLTIFHTGNTQAAIDETLSGVSVVPRHYLEADGFVTLVLQTDASVTGAGFTISWAPLR